VLEAGEIDGTNWWTEFSKIILPMVWPTFALQLVLLFCGIFGSSGNVFLLTGGDYDTMTLNAWMYIQLFKSSGNQYTSTVYNYLSAVGVILTVIAVFISLVIRRFTDKVFDEVEF
jgi:ABC-type sugar transport system permease subunit